MFLFHESIQVAQNRPHGVASLKPPCDLGMDLSQMRGELVAVVERARELIQGRGERTILPAWEKVTRPRPGETQAGGEPSRKTEMSCLR